MFAVRPKMAYIVEIRHVCYGYQLWLLVTPNASGCYDLRDIYLSFDILDWYEIV